MVNYRRVYIPGGLFAFTLALYDRHQSLLIEHIQQFKASLAYTKQRFPFDCIAICVLPEHIHMIWQLPVDAHDYSTRIRILKEQFTRHLLMQGHQTDRRDKTARCIWQRRFWEHAIRSSSELQRQVDYLHYNPVKHGWVNRVCDWPHSSFHRYVRDGWLPIHWGGDATNGSDMHARFFGE
jgi:putative transposase